MQPIPVVVAELGYIRMTGHYLTMQLTVDVPLKIHSRVKTRQLPPWYKYYPIQSCTVVSHIYQDNCGKVPLENIHPFTS
jgi:hypothetical protein